MSSLLWKEWHEQRWRLAFGCLILCAFAAIGLRARVVADETVLLTVCFIGMLLLPVLTSSGLVPAERGEGTLHMLLSLPLPPRRLLAAKTLAGFFCCAVPFVLAWVVSLCVAGQRELSNIGMFEIYGRSMAAAIILFTWMLTLSIRLPTEGRASLLSIGVLVMALIPLSANNVRVISPFIFTIGFHETYGDFQVALALLIHLTVGAVLWNWAAGRLAVED